MQHQPERAMNVPFRVWVKRHQLATYFILAYAITWMLLPPLVAQVSACQRRMCPRSGTRSARSDPPSPRSV